MTTERNQIHPQELIERLRLKVAALEQRIRDKDELVEEIKSQRDKFENHLIKLTEFLEIKYKACLLYTSPSPRDGLLSRMPSSA